MASGDDEGYDSEQNKLHVVIVFRMTYGAINLGTQRSASAAKKTSWGY